jgi:hypothetical protein
MVSFVILQFSSSFVEAKVLIEPLLASFDVIASSPNISLEGVKPVDLETTVLWFHTTFINSSGYFPLGRQFGPSWAWWSCRIGERLQVDDDLCPCIL